MISGSIGGFLVFLVPVFHPICTGTTCWYQAAQVRAVLPMVPVGTRWDRRVTSSAAVGAAVTRKTTGLPVTRWLEPRCTALVQRLARRCRAGAGGWFKTNSPVSPVVRHWYYPVVPGGAPVVLFAAGVTQRSTAGARRYGS